MRAKAEEAYEEIEAEEKEDEGEVQIDGTRRHRRINWQSDH
ncbi:unnamed protein product [Medioppia subpectinata]|uniref:Uncharacterized protein n=1 Tax=Medioppia subpectinata TaxID=1979941 RepID=A0A7R9PVC2_9ACAR|nr:unnamed protein product [Medioppia subpectinata]CAG2102476.1 unnamed protein product [Medioppia subpectinata]